MYKYVCELSEEELKSVLGHDRTEKGDVIIYNIYFKKVKITEPIRGNIKFTVCAKCIDLIRDLEVKVESCYDAREIKFYEDTIVKIKQIQKQTQDIENRCRKYRKSIEKLGFKRVYNKND
jgi:hypothetical protein